MDRELVVTLIVSEEFVKETEYEELVASLGALAYQALMQTLARADEGLDDFFSGDEPVL